MKNRKERKEKKRKEKKLVKKRKKIERKIKHEITDFYVSTSPLSRLESGPYFKLNSKKMRSFQGSILKQLKKKKEKMKRKEN